MQLNKMLAQLLIPVSDQVSRFMHKMLPVLFYNFGLLTAEFTFCSWMIMFRGSSDNNGKMSEAVSRMQWVSTPALVPNQVILVMTQIWLYRGWPSVTCLCISFISNYPSESERWTQEHVSVVVTIIKVTFSHICTAKAIGSRMFMPIHLHIINTFLKIYNCSHLHSVLRMTMKKRIYDGKKVDIKFMKLK